MHTRLFHGEIQPGKEEEAWQVLNEFAHRVKQHKGCILTRSCAAVVRSSV